MTLTAQALEAQKASNRRSECKRSLAQRKHSQGETFDKGEALE